MKNTHEQAVEILGPYAMPHDLARLYYGRLLWAEGADAGAAVAALDG